MDANEILIISDYETTRLRTWNGFTHTYNPPLYIRSTSPLVYGPDTTITIRGYGLEPDAQGYHKLNFEATPISFRAYDEGNHNYYVNYTPVENTMAILDEYPTETNVKQAVYVSPTGHTFTTDSHAGDLQWFVSKVTYTGVDQSGHTRGPYIVYLGFRVVMPTLQQISPITMTYESTYRLTESGAIPAEFVVTNPFFCSIYGKMDNDDTYTISTNLSRATAQYNFTSNDIGERTYTLKIDYSNTLASDTTLYYFYDDNNQYHSLCQSYKYYNDYPTWVKRNPYVTIYNNTIEYRITVLDNSNIFQLNSVSVSPVRASNHVAAQYYLTDTGAIKLIYSFSYTGGGNRYTVKLYDKSRTNGTVFIEKQFSSSSSTVSETLYSETLTRVETVDLYFEVVDNFNRILSHDFGLISIREYSRPKITYFDAYYSKSDGSLDLQSTHISALTSFTYTPLDGTNLLTQQLQVRGGSSIIATIDPEFTTNVRKYFNDITLPLGSDYEIIFTITDTMGNSASVTFPLIRTGNVLMDFNNTGFGMAIGKTSEEDSLEVNLPTIFYDDVNYINGTRQTADAASILGCMDTYNIGVRTIQAALDYIIGRLV